MSVALRPGLYLLSLLILSGCIDPPPPTKLVELSIDVGDDRCPILSEPVRINLNDKIQWQLNSTAPGFDRTEAYSVEFDQTNPTYCTDRLFYRKQESITCTIKADAQPGAYCYTVASYFDGAAASCQRRFALQVATSTQPDC